MGGNALKEPSIRLGADKYYSLIRPVTTELERTQAFTRVGVIASYSEKESFGDMDILVCTDSGEWPQGFKESSFLQNREVVWNGPVCSLGWDLIEGRFQIDLILVPTLDYSVAAGYFAYNDLGNLLGIIAKSLGFKLGHKGLWKRFYHPDKPTELIYSVLVSKDWSEILQFLGIPTNWIEYWRVGLDSLEQIFRLVQSSKYYHPDLYLLENRNSVSRVRDAKRVNYNKFLAWCENQEPWSQYWPKDPGDFLQKAFDTFPEFKVRFLEKSREWSRIVQVKSLISGQKVRELTGIDGVELGKFMQLFKAVPLPEQKVTFLNREFTEGYILGLYSLWYKLSEVSVANQIAGRLRDLDYSVVIFNPEELSECNQTTINKLEETLINKGNDIIDQYNPK